MPTTSSKKRQSPKLDREVGHHHKSTQTRLRVTVAGQTINPGKAAEVFSTALEPMGLERVAQLDMRHAGIALVSRHPGTG